MAGLREVLLFTAIVGGLGLAGHLVARCTGSPPAQPLPSAAWAIPFDDPQLGERAYAQCRGCHQPDGGGISGTYPPLAGNPRATGEPTALIRIALHGYDSRQPGLPYPWLAPMPGLGGRLADHELAGALTFIRSRWGNAAPPITAAQVAAVRADDALRLAPWTPDELTCDPQP
jgi:mono/diheme cytochrome c family protein